MIEKKVYYDVLEEIENLGREDKFSEKVESIYLGGSVARGDFTPGRSDIDIYVVLKERDEGLEEQFEEKLEDIEREHLSELKKVDPNPLGATFTSLEEIKQGQSFLGQGFEYRNFIRTGELLSGKDIKDKIPEPTREEEVKSAAEFLNKFEERYQAIEKKFTRKLFSSIFRVLSVLLNGSGIYVSSKEGIIKKCHDHFGHRSKLNSLLKDTLSLWKKWGSRELDKEEFCSLYRKYKKIMPIVYEIWHETTKK